MSRTEIAFVSCLAAALISPNIVSCRGVSDAISAARDARRPEMLLNDFDFVTRGIRKGTPYETVKELLEESGHVTLSRFDEGSEYSYFVYGWFDYRGRPFRPLFDWEQNYVVERYEIYLDAERKVAFMHYGIFLDGSGQKFDIDFTTETLSRPLNLGW